MAGSKNDIEFHAPRERKRLLQTTAKNKVVPRRAVACMRCPDDAVVEQATLVHGANNLKSKKNSLGRNSFGAKTEVFASKEKEIIR